MKHTLFNHIKEAEIEEIKVKFGRKLLYFKNDWILKKDEIIKGFAYIELGSVQEIHEDRNGNRDILNIYQQGQIFVEGIGEDGNMKVTRSYQTLSDCSIIWFTFSELVRERRDSIIQMTINMMEMIVEKNIDYKERIELLSKRSIRSRMKYYFECEVKKAGDNHFVIEFDRNELADYLCVNRSALSRELSNMKQEGLINYRKNEFWFKL